jgi:hypothetical protein
VAARGGQPILPRSLLRLPGMVAGLAGLFTAMAIFGGWLFGLTLQLQDALGESALRAGLTFVPCGAAFAIVSLNWRRLPARHHTSVVSHGFLVCGAGLLASGLLLRDGGSGGDWLYVALGVAGGGLAGAFGAQMTQVLSRVPVALAADASGVVVTVMQLGIVTGIATFGALYLNLAGRLPSVQGRAADAARAAFTLSASHAYLAVCAGLAVLALAGFWLAVAHVRGTVRHAASAVATPTTGRVPEQAGRD